MRMLRMRTHFKGIPFFSRVQGRRTIGRRGTDRHFRIYAAYNGLRIAGDMYTCQRCTRIKSIQIERTDAVRN